MSLKKSAWLRAAVSIPAVWLLMFLPAGTFAYWQAWVLLAIMTFTGSFTSLYFWRRDPKLLERRMRLREEERAQNIIVALLYALLMATVVCSALDHRMRWSVELPLLAVAGDCLVIAGWYVYFAVFRENSFAAATIQVAADQRVVSTGPYSVVRHPLYVGLLLSCIGFPLALGSYWSLLLVIPITALLVLRLSNEEAFLTKQLPGYAEYCVKVRWRLVPGLY